MTGKKKAFDLPRDSVYSAEPIADLRIIGGAGLLVEEESGELDTEYADGMPLKDLRRLKKALDEEFCANVAFHGVKIPIIIAKIEDVATVVAGKSRVRALRRANHARLERGEPLMRVRCIIQRDTTHEALFATMVTENNARRDDDLADKIEKAIAMIDSGKYSEQDVALHFTVKQTTLRGWLDFDDHATDATKQAVKEGRVGASTAAELAKIHDPEEQNKALAEMLIAPEPRGRSARAAKMLRKGGAKVGNASDRKTQVTLLSFMQAASHPRASEKTMAWWEGAEEMLKLVTGSKETDEKLLKILNEARIAAKSTKAAKD